MQFSLNQPTGASSYTWRFEHPTERPVTALFSYKTLVAISFNSNIYVLAKGEPLRSRTTSRHITAFLRDQPSHPQVSKPAAELNIILADILRTVLTATPST